MKGRSMATSGGSDTTILEQNRRGRGRLGTLFIHGHERLVNDITDEEAWDIPYIWLTPLDGT